MTQIPIWVIAAVSLSVGVADGLLITLLMGAPAWAGYAFGAGIYHLLMLGAQISAAAREIKEER